MFATIVLALLPIVLLIALGYVLRHRGVLDASFWAQAERLTYFFLLPALFLHAMSTAELGGVPVGALVAALVFPILFVSAGLVIANRFFRIDGPAFTSVFQGGIRFNNYIALTAAVGLFGPPAIALAAVASATIVPTVNVLCVLVFAQNSGARPSPWQVVRGIAANPLVASSVIGILLQATGLGLPPGLDGFFRALGAASLPLGLLCVGAALDWEAVGRAPRLSVISSVAKFVAMPLCTVAACLALGLDGMAAMVAVLFNAMPTASSSYVLARQLGGDAPLMAGIVALQTVVAAATVPAAIFLADLVL